jgi:hypothetical protein
MYLIHIYWAALNTHTAHLLYVIYSNKEVKLVYITYLRHKYGISFHFTILYSSRSPSAGFAAAYCRCTAVAGGVRRCHYSTHRRSWRPKCHCAFVFQTQRCLYSLHFVTTLNQTLVLRVSHVLIYSSCYNQTKDGFTMAVSRQSFLTAILPSGLKVLFY